ncbi:DUF779 domain-containing protein [Frankia sp. CNm7]|uniref:DUF779 domain-containing protein n=1 Tax=Frankia nepalensis TaxID=1836974 RepID=A0A937UTS4_9ACTN|nr:DUF779 domain-containing protein [Frankia nepalensis]MBL7497486.1 DUF779 domain-containing protein [Frankia nepalensis]MBL7509573.1 DUF779 domain-containing protein [Frankia nepalensis]MBL7517747.1 DUF779 domain-containing protein [Frankia nepalensis]MBL7633388.1 DUF779 domain-containing protein [Frankia nepalensis]
MGQVRRVDATPAAVAMLRSLTAAHGPLMIHQSGGCCDGSSPMCYPRGEFLVGDEDVLLGVLDLDDPASLADPTAWADPDRPVGRAEPAPARGRQAGDGPAGVTVPVYIGGAQFAYWSHTRLTIDLVPGRGGGFSLEAPEGYRFLTRSRLFTEDETEALDAAGPPHRGPLTTPEPTR